MKRAYWFVLAFLIWCALCALWYLFGVKGVLISDPKYFHAASRFIAIAEILFMLLGACLLGFAIAWWLRAEVISASEVSIDRLKSENEYLIKSKEESEKQLQILIGRQAADSSAFKLKISELNHEKETLNTKLEHEEGLGHKLKIESAERKYLLDQKNSENNSLIIKINELESETKSLEQSNLRLREEIKKLDSISHEKATVSYHPFVRPAINDRKDDLTKIKGIGPFVEKRLNMLGIYTFTQLSELEPEMIERVGAAIEFFPGRIIRDNWIGQAKNLA